jgi:hypothetical protein
MWFFRRIFHDFSAIFRYESTDASLVSALLLSFANNPAVSSKLFYFCPKETQNDFTERGETMNHFSVLMQFLRDHAQFIEEIRSSRRLDQKIVSLVICSCLFFALYGAIMGSYSGGLQVLASAAKLPALYLLTLLICLPSLFFFEVISGSKFTFAQYLALLLIAMAAMGMILFSFAPISLFFRLSVADYTFFKLLNVVILGIAGVLGIQVFYRSAIALREKDINAPKHRPNILRGWLLLYAFVGSQLGWTLRPFFGSPGLEFQLFRNIESNFYAHLLKLITQRF